MLRQKELRAFLFAVLQSCISMNPFPVIHSERLINVRHQIKNILANK